MFDIGVLLVDRVCSKWLYGVLGKCSRGCGIALDGLFGAIVLKGDLQDGLFWESVSLSGR